MIRSRNLTKTVSLQAMSSTATCNADALCAVLRQHFLPRHLASMTVVDFVLQLNYTDWQETAAVASS